MNMLNDMKYMKLIITMVLVLFLFSCKKDKPLICIDNPIAGCPEQYTARTTAYKNIQKWDENPNCLFMPNYIQTTNFLYSKPISNPNNSGEILIRRINQIGATFGDLCIYNFCDNSLKVIVDNSMSYRFDWSSDNWIIFNGHGGILWKVKPDGTNFIQLTDHGGVDAVWSPDGSKYLYRVTGLPTGSNMRVSFSDGSFDRIIPHNMQSWVWLSDKEVLFSNNNTIYKYNFEDEETILFASLPIQRASFMQYKYETLFVSANNGFYEIKNNESLYIDSSYLTYKSYHVQAITPNYLLLHRIIQDTSDYANCNVHVTNVISLYNRTTKEERMINLPY